VARIGPAMRMITDYVSAVPGCSKREVMREASMASTYMGLWRALERAINAGLVIVDSECPWVHPTAHAVFANERDKTIFYLRNELLRGKPTPQHADEIRTEVERLRAEQATTWVDQ
jgi:hypothetical protein